MKIAVIGGGAAGFFAAIHAAEAGHEVVIYEKSHKVLSKVKISGGGRCNVTNAATDPAEISLNYPRGGKELRGPFTRFGTMETSRWFEDRGIRLKVEPDGRVFPVSDSSQTIIDCLLHEIRRNQIKLMTGKSIRSIQPQKEQFALQVDDIPDSFDKVIIATGGSPNPDSYQWIKELGHHIIDPVPSLFTFNIPQNPCQELMGVAVENVHLRILGSKFESEGPLLFTHWGLSGPAVLKLSARAARHLHELNYDFDVAVNFFAGRNEEAIRNLLTGLAASEKLKKIRNTRLPEIPSRLWEKVCELSGIHSSMNWADAGKKTMNTLIANLTALTFHVQGKTTFKEEFVTCGGVDLKEVNMQTMESRLVPGLYFAGEVLNIDGVTGGFNFQAAWTTGYLAGTNASKKNPGK